MASCLRPFSARASSLDYLLRLVSGRLFFVVASKILIFGFHFLVTTEYWVESHARNSKNDKAQGRIKVGLFGGSKDLNIAYGWRYNRTDTSSLIQENVIQYIWWLLTTVGVGLGLLCSFISGVASVIRAASSAKKHGTMVILFVSNISALMSQLVALIAWAIQFYKSLTKNVLLAEDLHADWNSDGLASFGSSYFFVIGGVVVAALNLALLIAALKVENRFKRRVQGGDHGDDKMHGAIMLY